ncbi:hypothetical protein [Paraburkholderia pallida]|uniref:Uncharacterized protein n=1 Tax=Paraburkholderia pallida TaxID=2547399 RepID=A0A4V1AZ64_9BURK|nr:hypothetical protein [Paraburkholderia pallida]QBQ98182.1 hypothetical protein E1956_14030 [Paraburkholderia pallida]
MDKVTLNPGKLFAAQAAPFGLMQALESLDLLWRKETTNEAEEKTPLSQRAQSGAMTGGSRDEIVDMADLPRTVEEHIGREYRQKSREEWCDARGRV